MIGENNEHGYASQREMDLNKLSPLRNCGLMCGHTRPTPHTKLSYSLSNHVEFEHEAADADDEQHRHNHKCPAQHCQHAPGHLDDSVTSRPRGHDPMDDGAGRPDLGEWEVRGAQQGNQDCHISRSNARIAELEAAFISYGELLSCLESSGRAIRIKPN